MMAGSVLVVDDDPAVGKTLGALLRQDGLETAHALSGAEAVELIEARPFDLVVSDLRMPGMTGIELLSLVAARWPDLPVVMLTAHGTVPIAVDAMKRGAADFLTKPFDREELLYVVHKALRVTQGRRERAPERARGAMVLGTSAAMEQVAAAVARVAPTLATVLVRGESGTGKELVARAVHEQSPRAAKPFVAVHCAALPENLLESELFGHEKGAFTGATARKPGRVELAQGGTLFLDEVGEIPLSMQVKLLRLLQERELERLGGTATIRADVRFVAATHRDLEAMVAAGGFRDDLFYRLAVVPIRVPALRERPEDIAPLAVHFCEEVARANRRSARLADDALDLLRAQPWRGNVRELHNFIERLVVLSDGPLLGRADVQRELAALLPPEAGPPPSDVVTLLGVRQSAERAALETALRKAGGNRSLAARILGVSRRTLYTKMHEHGLI